MSGKQKNATKPGVWTLHVLLFYASSAIGFSPPINATTDLAIKKRGNGKTSLGKHQPQRCLGRAWSVLVPPAEWPREEREGGGCPQRILM